MTATRKNILVAIDFEEQSIVALDQTIKLAEFLRSGITLLHVIETGNVFDRFFRFGDEEIQRAKSLALEKLNELTEKYAGSISIPLETIVETGKVYSKILALSTAMQARFIIIGKNASDSNVRTVLGSNAIHIVEEAKVPVITIAGREHKIGYRNIVVPLDLTKQTREQIFNALTFGMHYKAHIKLVSVLIGGIKARKSRIFTRLKRAQRTLLDNGVDCSIELLKRGEKHPYELVMEYAEEIDADLIMVMTHQESTSNDNYIGAFAQRIINYSNVPVLSFTYAASNENESIIKSVVDPLNVFTEKKKKKRFVKFKS
jgi:nucleotide-binding universal stress UspA family protein